LPHFDALEKELACWIDKYEARSDDIYHTHILLDEITSVLKSQEK